MNFEQLSAERKELTAKGEIPEWFTTQGWKHFKSKVQVGDEAIKGAFKRISNHVGGFVKDSYPEATEKFFDIMWRGVLAPSTPVWSNAGTNRGHCISCSGSYVEDSVDGFFKAAHENALLSKNGYGTSAYLGDIRPRGSKTSTGLEANGIVPVIKQQMDMADMVSQGGRRGAVASYVPVDHGDFWEVCDFIKQNPEVNIGWVFTDSFIDLLKNKDPEAIKRFNRVQYVRATRGKGYVFKTGHANRNAPEGIRESNIAIKGSNLCVEISLPQDAEHTFSCVLSSLNLVNWDKTTDEDIFYSVLFLDCLIEDMLEKAKDEAGFDKIVRFTKKARALGLGTLGFHSYLQSKMIPFDSVKAKIENEKIFKRINNVATEASKEIGAKLGYPEWCEKVKMRNATLTAIAPNTASALLCGSVSQGIEPWVGCAFTQKVASGEVTRYNPAFIELLKSKGKYSLELLDELAQEYDGSCQHLDFLTEDEKDVFKTAFEINQEVLVDLASQRQKYICQAQSLNLFFDDDELYIARVMKKALLDERLISVYYQRSKRNIKAAKEACANCAS